VARPGTARRPPPLDRHVLYERAVQSPDTELALLTRLLGRAGQPARRLREDFSGTALLSACWVEGGPDRTAVAVDLDPAVHRWAARHRLPALGAAARRLQLVQADVRRAPRGPFDAILALNFSYQVFRERAALKAYLTAARRALVPGGLLMLDLFGGWLSHQQATERRRIGGGVTYVWEHEACDAITHRIRCAIHFELPGGRRLRRAFTYDWRLWSLPELRDLMAEAGFDRIEVQWDVEPPGVEPRYRPRRHAANQGAWLAYLVGRRPGQAARQGPLAAAGALA
jgi:SAM-dependent methyltransferase